MRVLALETVGTTGTIAVLDGDTLLAERRLDPRGRSAQTLAPTIQELLGAVGWRPGDVELIGVTEGPGSFTGLRIGVTTAKTLAYAIGCPVIGVNSLRAIAARVSTEIASVSVALDAQRGELFVADFQRGADGALAGEDSTRVIAVEPWIAGLPSGTIVSGPALVKWNARLPAGVSAVPEELWFPAAVEVGRLAWSDHRRGQTGDAFALVPRYFRRTAAEEQWDRKAQDA